MHEDILSVGKCFVPVQIVTKHSVVTKSNWIELEYLKRVFCILLSWVETCFCLGISKLHLYPVLERVLLPKCVHTVCLSLWNFYRHAFFVLLN